MPIPISDAVDEVRGIGLMIANGFIDAGARVYISSRRADVCEQVAAELSRWEGVHWSALVANARGATRSVDAGGANLEYVVSASDGHSRANAGRSTAEIRESFRTLPGELRGYLTVVPETRWGKHPKHLRVFLEDSDLITETDEDGAYVLGDQPGRLLRRWRRARPRAGHHPHRRWSR